jgi:hypothetical protein
MFGTTQRRSVTTGEGFVLDDLQTISASRATLFTPPRQGLGRADVTSGTVTVVRLRFAADLSPGKTMEKLEMSIPIIFSYNNKLLFQRNKRRT